jgi:hypothetical protein
LALGTEQMTIFFSFEGFPGRHGKKNSSRLSMENDVEHLGNDLGIDDKSSISSSLRSNSDAESSSSSYLSHISEESVITTPASDHSRFNQQAFKTIL